MKERPAGFLCQSQIPHESEQFDYIRELHLYLWRFVRTVHPGASGRIGDVVDAAIDELEERSSAASVRPASQQEK